MIDAGDLDIRNPEVVEVKDPKLRYLPEIAEACQQLSVEVEHALDKDEFPLVLGGDHSMAIGTISGIASHCKKHKKRFGDIWIDAHSDINTPETSPSGNIHGMPFATLLGYGDPGLVELGGFSPKIDPRFIAHIGARDLDEGELHAPSDGMIENRILEPGDMASPQKPVFTLALTDPVWVRTWLAEPQLGRVPVGARAWVRTDSHPDKRYRAWVGYVSPSAEFTPKSVETAEIRSSLVYQARVFVCEGQGELRLGMPATVTIPLDQTPPAQGAAPCTGSK